MTSSERAPLRVHGSVGVCRVWLLLPAVFAFVVLLLLPSVTVEAYEIGTGVVWRAQRSGTTADLLDVTFLDASRGWAVGRGGTILHTSDGGATWAPQPSGVTTDLLAVCFVDAESGWAVGGDDTILRTLDGGATWERPAQWGVSETWKDVCFVDESTGWIVGGGSTYYDAPVLLSTTDGGSTWQVTREPGEYRRPLEALTFTDAQTGWMVGWEGIILHTTNGGATWQTQHEASIGGIKLKDVAFIDSSTGWAVGGGSNNWGEHTILKTADGGVTWEQQFWKAGTTIGGVAPLDRDHAWVVDWFDSVLLTDDGGATWQEQHVVGAFNAVAFVDAVTGWVVGDGGAIVETVPQMQATPSFADTASCPYLLAVENLAAAGIAAGYDDGTFRPDVPLLRAQFAKMICLALKLPVDESMVAPFSDLGPDYLGTLYHHEYIAAAAANGIVNGTHPGIFDPWDDVTRAQVVTMVVRALKKLEPLRLATPPVDFRGSYVPLDPTHGDNLRVAEFNHLLDGLVGIGKGWNPWAKMTRGEIAQVLWNARDAAGATR
jgi:photosystem II stability/assembly factor-like uncharacterized protein